MLCFVFPFPASLLKRFLNAPTPILLLWSHWFLGPSQSLRPRLKDKTLIFLVPRMKVRVLRFSHSVHTHISRNLDTHWSMRNDALFGCVPAGFNVCAGHGAHFGVVMWFSIPWARIVCTSTWCSVEFVLRSVAATARETQNVLERGEAEGDQCFERGDAGDEYADTDFHRWPVEGINQCP